MPCGPDLNEARNVFVKKFYDKTKNEWSERQKFVKVAGKYDLLKMDYSVDDGKEESVKKKLKTEVKEEISSKIDQSLQTFVQLICNIKAMEDAVVEMQYDCKKSPLGELHYLRRRYWHIANMSLKTNKAFDFYVLHMMEISNIPKYIW